MWQIWFVIVIILLITLYFYPNSFLCYTFFASSVVFMFSLWIPNLILTTSLFILLSIFFKITQQFINFPFQRIKFFLPKTCILHQTGIVIGDYQGKPLETGFAKINHEIWPITSYQALNKGQLIQVESIQGIKLIVTPIKH